MLSLMRLIALTEILPKLPSNRMNRYPVLGLTILSVLGNSEIADGARTNERPIRLARAQVPRN